MKITDIIKMAQIRQFTIVIPFVVIGLVLLLLGIIVFWRKHSQKACGVRYPGLAGALLIVNALCWLFLNALLLLIPLLAWLLLTIVFVIRENKSQDPVDKTVNRFVPWFKRGTKERIVADIVAFILVFGGIFPFLFSGFVYQSVFGFRSEYFGSHTFRVEDFDGLCRDEMTFESDKGQELAGYLYYADGDEDQRGVVVFGHGFGCGGHSGYMACINYFTSHGYYVFAYDATGTDYSQGDMLYGLPQQIIDMDYAISYVEKLDKTKKLPIVLWGHSWGGYTVTNELQFHPEVKAVCAFSGFNYSMDLIEAWGPNYVGPLTYYLIPYIRIHQQMILGDIAESKAMECFQVSQAGVMSVTADNDTIVPQKYGYDIWFEKYSDNSRFRFKLITDLDEDVSHSHVFCSAEYIEAMNDLNENDYQKWLENLDYDYKDKKNQERLLEDSNAYAEQDYVRKLKTTQVNEDLFNEVLAFYDEFIEK